MTVRQAQEQQRIAALKLAQVLHLDPSVDLAAEETELVPLKLFAVDPALDDLIRRSAATRPELKQNRALVLAAREVRNGTTYGPLVPSVGAQVFLGGLGGGRAGVSDSFGGQEDYFVGASWRIGPGGLFDFGRVRTAESRVKSAELALDRQSDDVVRQVGEAFT